MKSVKEMSYKELEDEVILNRCELSAATVDRKRELMRRTHELLTEMDMRWERIGNWWTK